MSNAIGVWCAAGSKLLAPIHDVPLLRLVSRRIGLPATALIPWASDLDHLDAEVRSWKGLLRVRRCWPEERIAMRDLVVASDASIGVLIDGACGVIDEDEVRLALARLEGSAERYESPRIKGFKRAGWLTINDTEEWAAPCSLDELRKLLGPNELDARMAQVLARRKLNS
jgi:hypothetical protein